MKHESDVVKSIQGLNGYVLDERTLRVDIAKRQYSGNKSARPFTGRGIVRCYDLFQRLRVTDLIIRTSQDPAIEESATGTIRTAGRTGDGMTSTTETETQATIAVNRCHMDPIAAAIP